MTNFLSLNGHILCMWCNSDTLLGALEKLAGDRTLRHQVEQFFEVDVIKLYWDYTQLPEHDQFLLSLECKAKLNATKYHK